MLESRFGYWVKIAVYGRSSSFSVGISATTGMALHSKVANPKVKQPGCNEAQRKPRGVMGRILQ